jgi:hypothetical protein
MRGSKWGWWIVEGVALGNDASHLLRGPICKNILGEFLHERSQRFQFWLYREFELRQLMPEFR